MGAAGFVLELILKVQQGRGLDYYFTGFGVKMNYLGVLILVMLAPVALLVAAGVSWWARRHERDFLRRYGRKYH
jgi:hypothetical protein